MTKAPYHITERQMEILAEVQLDADLPIADVAKRVKLPEFTVRRTLTLLHEQGIIERLWYLNPFADGYVLYDIFFQLTPAGLAKPEKLIQVLARSPEVEFITELTGTFSLGVVVRCRTPEGVAEFIGRVCAACPGVISAKDVSTFLSLTDVPIFRSSRQSRRRARLSFASNSNATSLDDIDERILSQMRATPSVSLAKLARALGMPATTVVYRVNVLKERGAIVGARYFVDMFRLGYSYVVHRISLAGNGLRYTDEVQERLQAIPGVYFTMRCLGRWDVVVGTVTQDMSALTACTTAIAATLGSHIVRVDTAHLIRFHKLNGSLYKSHTAAL